MLEINGPSYIFADNAKKLVSLLNRKFPSFKDIKLNNKFKPEYNNE